jgi:hypothetical protein
MTGTELNRAAMSIPEDRLVEALKERIEAKRQVLAERDRRLGADRVRIGSYMENLALPELFGFDMNRLFADPRFALELELRHRIFWADNTEDDWLPGLEVLATTGMYFDITLFGQEVRHTPGGVPNFMPHPIAERPDLALVPPFDFHKTGTMPALIRQYQEMSRLAGTLYGGQVTVGFAHFRRGPLDVCMQLRGYENFVGDTMDRPEFVHAMLAHVVAERARWNVLKAQFIGEPAAKAPTCSIHDDWVNVPFISPDMFRRFVLPAYRQVQRNEGPLTNFHTCGIMTPIIQDLLAEAPGLRTLDVSGWNDFELLDRLVDPGIGFWLNFINSFVLTATPEQHAEKLTRIARVRKRRKVGLGAQAIVRLHDDIAEDIRRMNAFIRLAREKLGE